MLLVARFLVSLVPFRFWRKTLGAISAGQGKSLPSETHNRASFVRARAIGRHVRRAAMMVPFRAVCLPQAMAARWMLLRRGIGTQLFIGARRGAGEKPFDFHAWLMFGDECLTGQEERDGFHSFQSSSKAAM